VTFIPVSQEKAFDEEKPIDAFGASVGGYDQRTNGLGPVQQD